MFIVVRFLLATRDSCNLPSLGRLSEIKSFRFIAESRQLFARRRTYQKIFFFHKVLSARFLRDRLQRFVRNAE